MNRPKAPLRGGPSSLALPSRGTAYPRSRPSLNGPGGASNTTSSVGAGAPVDFENAKTHPSSRNKNATSTTFDQEMANFCRLIPSLSMLDSIITRDNSTLTAMQSYKDSNTNPQDVISATYQDVLKRIESMETKITSHKDERERRFAEISDSFKGAIHLYVDSVISAINIPALAEEKHSSTATDSSSKENQPNTPAYDSSNVPPAIQAWVSKEIDRKLVSFKEQIQQYFENQKAAREKSDKIRDLAENEMRQKMDSMEKQLRMLTMQQQENHQTFQQYGSKLQRVMDLQQSVHIQHTMPPMDVVPTTSSLVSPLTSHDSSMPSHVPPGVDSNVHPDHTSSDRAYHPDPRLLNRQPSSYSPNSTSPHHNSNQRNRYVTREELEAFRKESNQRISSRKKDLAEVKVELADVKKDVSDLLDFINDKKSKSGKRDDGQQQPIEGSMAVDEVPGGDSRPNESNSLALVNMNNSNNSNNGDTAARSQLEWAKIKDLVRRRAEDIINANVDTLREKIVWLDSRLEQLENEHAVSQAKIARLSKR